MKKKSNAGRKTVFTTEMLTKIRNSILEGNNLKETARICNLDVQTLYNNHSNNYERIRDKIDGWKRDRKLELAEKNIEEMLQMSTTNKAVTRKGELYEFKDTGILKVKADISKFTAETLGKSNYSKRSELSGVDGSELIPSEEKRKQSNKALSEFIDNK